MRFLGLLVLALLVSSPAAHAEMTADAAMRIALETVPGGEVVDLSVYEKGSVKIYDVAIRVDDKAEQKKSKWIGGDDEDENIPEIVRVGVDANSGEVFDSEELIARTTQKVFDIIEAKQIAVDYIKGLSKGRSTPLALGYEYKNVNGRPLYTIDITDKGRTFEVSVDAWSGRVNAMEERL